MIKNTIKGHPIRIFATLLIATALLTGCVEINEKIIINDDGSGNFSMSVGIESNNFIFGLFSAYSDLSFLDHSDNELKKVSKILQTQKGIQNVIYQFDRKSGRVGISFDFTNSKSLNKALYAIANHEKTIFMPAVYKVNKHSFSRKNTTKWLNMLMEQNEEKMPDELLLELVRVNSVYQFPKPVRKIKGSNVTVNEDGMVVSTSNVLSDILEQNINTRIRVRF